MKKHFIFFSIIITFFLISCSTLNVENPEKTETTIDKTIGYKDLKWTFNKKTVQKAMINQEVNIHSKICKNILDETEVTITIKADFDGKTIEIDTIKAKVKDKKVFASLLIQDKTEFYDEKKYFIPKFYFEIKSKKFHSEKSPILEVYGSINQKLVDKDGVPKANEKYLIQKKDGSTISGKRDKNGYVKLDWLPLGNYEILRVKEKENGK